MHEAARFSDLPDRRGIRVEVAGEKILLVRDGDGVHAFAAVCPHAGAPLEEGAICNGRIVCPWHKGTFRLSDGALLEPPPLEGLARYPVQIKDGAVFVLPEKIVATPKEAATSDSRTFLIIGAGAAGAAAVAALKEAGFGGTIVIAGREPGDPYDRTALSKFVLAGSMPPDEVPPILPSGALGGSRIERYQEDVIRLNVPEKWAELSGGRRLAYDAAMIATGGVPRLPELPGRGLPGVHALRTREDAAAILKSAKGAARAVILGNSFIGLETASCLREQRIDVTVIAPDDTPFRRQFGPALGAMFRRLHEANGVTFRAGAAVTHLEGARRVTAVALSDGSRLPADLVVFGVGVQPATSFLDGVATTDDGGIPVDAGMRAGNGLYAAGDVARFRLPGTGAPVRIEHWRVAQQHARIAAHNMLGGAEIYDGVPFFWTYAYGKRFEYLGHADEWDETVVDGDPDQQAFVALFVRGGLVRAALACQRERNMAVLAERLRAPLQAETALRIIRQG